MNNQHRAVVVGGSNGLGLAIAKNLIEKGFFIEICDRSRPDDSVLSSGSFQYNYCDLLDFNEDLFYPLHA